MEHRTNDQIQNHLSVKFVLDSQGNGWYCDAKVSEDGDLFSQGCLREEEVIYDRGFGG